MAAGTWSLYPGNTMQNLPISSEKKLGYHKPNLAYDLPEVLLKVQKLTRMGEQDGLPKLLDSAQLLLDMVKRDVESHLILLENRIHIARKGLNHDNSESGGLQHLESTQGR